MSSSAIHKEIHEGTLDQDSLEECLRNGCDINGLYDGKTPLALAVTFTDFTAIEALLQQRALDLNAPCEDNRTALWYATVDPVISSHDAYRICQLLVWSGADCNIKSTCKRGTSPMDNAIRAEESDISDFFEDPLRYLPLDESEVSSDSEPLPPYNEFSSGESSTSAEDSGFAGSTMDSATFETHLIHLDNQKPEIHELPAGPTSEWGGSEFRSGARKYRRAPSSLRGGTDPPKDRLGRIPPASSGPRSFPLNKPFVNLGAKGARPIGHLTPVLRTAPPQVWRRPDERNVRSMIAFVKHLLFYTNALTSYQDVLGQIPKIWQGVIWKLFRYRGEKLPPQALSSLDVLPSQTSSSHDVLPPYSPSQAEPGTFNAAVGPSVDITPIPEVSPQAILRAHQLTAANQSTPEPVPVPVAVIPDPDSPAALTEHMHNQIHLLGLEHFFPEGDPFIDNLIEKASALVEKGRVPRNSINSTNSSIHSSETGETATTASEFIAHPDNVRGLMRLALFQPVLFLDNSGSMRFDEGSPISKIGAMKETVKRVARITTELVPQDYGIHIRFINDSPSFPAGRSYSDLDEIESRMEDVKYKGGTLLGTNLRKFILEHLVYGPVERGDLRRPLLISVVTDGEVSSYLIGVMDDSY